MEFVKGHIYGFGKLQNIPLEFGRGFQIIFVKEEQDRNSIFQFLLDMLFGQKLSSRKNTLFTENYYKYTPWHTQDYRGNIVYRLNSGKIIHLHRVFGSKSSLKVYEGLDVKDITSTFPVYPNGEPAFIRSHLDLDRKIFSGIATISQKMLENLYGQTPHCELRKHLRCLIDTGTTVQSLQDIITTFQDYLQSIGTERTYKKPRNYISEQLERLLGEYEQAKIHLQEIRQRKALLKECKEQWRLLQEDYEKIQERLQYTRHYALWRRKNDAKALREKLDQLTARSFAYSSYRNFSMDQKSIVIQSEMAIQHAETQKERLQNEVECITREINDLERELHHSSFVPIDFIKDYQEKFEEYLKHISGNEEVLKELLSQRERVKKQIQEVEKIVSEFPELIQKDDMFYQKVDIAIDLYKSSLKETQRSEEQFNVLKREHTLINEQIQPFQDLFKEVADFNGLVCDYMRYKEKPEEEQRELERELQNIEELKLFTKSRQWVPLILGPFCFIVLLCLIYFYIFFGKKESLLFISIVVIALIYFLHNYISGKKELKKLDIDRERLKEHIQRLLSSEYIEKHPITALLSEANLEHVRELQGLYEQYCVLLKQQDNMTKEVKKAEELFNINLSRTNELYLNMKELFERVELLLGSEDEIERNRRKVFELQEKMRMYNRRLWDLREQYQQLSDTISRKEEYIRKIHHNIQEEILNRIGKELVQSGLLQSGELLTPETFRSYYHAEEVYRGLRVKISELRKKRLDFHQQIQKFDEEILYHQEQIREILELSGVANLSEWKSKCARAEEAYTLFSMIEQTELQLQQLLENETLEELEKRTQDFVPSVPAEKEEELQFLLEQRKKEIEQVQQDIHSLQSELQLLTEKLCPLNEILEEKNYYETQWKAVQHEQESVLLALSVLQQLSTYRYHKISLPLQNEVCRLFAKLTHGKYEGVLIEQDLTIKIVPVETRKAIPLEEISTKQSVLESLYFAIRTALMRIPHYLKESLPLLLEDPFIQYDYPQLIQVLNILKILGEEQQIILFTYRNDIFDIANNLSIPIAIIDSV